jgi:putative endonuclease
MLPRTPRSAVLTRNYRCRSGEVDLVCRERNVIVFVEVRLRRNTNYGGAAASITADQAGRIVFAAEHYLTNELRREADCRFDCILLDGLCDAPSNGFAMRFRHLG